MSAHDLIIPRDHQYPPWQSLDELHTILAQYRADDDSWPYGLVNLRYAIRAKVAAATGAR
jgi:hypothetical protein